MRGERVDQARRLGRRGDALPPASDGRELDAARRVHRNLVERERVTVLVNPDDLELVRVAADDLRAGLGGIGHCEIQAERRVGAGGAIVRYTEGEIDATMLTKLERAREVVAEHLGARR